MKKLICFFLLFCVVLSASSCQTVVEIEGIDSYPFYSSLEIEEYLLPCKGDPYEMKGEYIKAFDYLDANHWLYSSFSLEKGLAYFVYTPEVYKEAMAYVRENTVFLPDVEFEVNGYTFLQRDMLYYIPNTITHVFPKWFWMTFYSEERNIIGFFGYYGHSEKPADENFEEFLRYEFPQYDWDA